MKEGTKTIIFIVGLFLIILLVGIFLILRNGNTLPNSENDFNPENSGDDGGDSTNPNTDDNSVGGLGGGSESGGASGGESGSSGSGNVPVCTEFVQITYSLMNIIKNQTCNTYSGGICVDKTVSCSVEIHNLETTAGGEFEVELYFVEEGKKKEDKFDSSISNFYLGPKTFEVFPGSTEITSTGADGLANKEINCFYNTLEVPKKEDC